MESLGVDLFPNMSAFEVPKQTSQLSELRNSKTKGLIHGHIHNYNNMMYIHGHIHSEHEGHVMSEHHDHLHHSHSNEPEALLYDDCQHFEFINYLNNTPDSVIDECCSPKVVEICCDADHHAASSSAVKNEPGPVSIPTDFDASLQEFIGCDMDMQDPCGTSCGPAGIRSVPPPKMIADFKDISYMYDLPIDFFDDPAQLAANSAKSKKRRLEDDKEEAHHHHHHQISLHDHHHGGRIVNFEWNFQKGNDISCQWESCDAKHDSSVELQKHILKSHIDEDTTKCLWTDCGFAGDDLCALVNHVNETHGIQFDMDEPVKTCLYKECPADKCTPLKKKQATETEQTVCLWNAGEGPCSMQFENAEQLQEHIINDHIGSGKSRYQCMWEGCSRKGREFTQRQKIIRHLHTHTKFKPHVCHICGHKFSVDSMLDQHMRTHSGEKPYECSTCGKKFATSSSLCIHRRIHTGEKPLCCKICGKKFSESSNLAKHMKLHTKEELETI